MLRTIVRWLGNLLGQTPDGDNSEERRFIPSQLDFSVRFSHGGGNTEGTRELEEINTKARMLDEERRNE